ncbi:MAG TPA: hypothetical protein VH438_01055 [Gemmatimonadales bacterium]
MRTVLPQTRTQLAALGLTTMALAFASCECDDDSGNTEPTGNANEMTAVSGDPQTAPVGSQLQPLIVLVVDDQAQPLANVTVDWNPTGPTSGTVNPATSTTGTDGKTQTLWTLPSVEGSYTVVANIPGTSITADFHAQATAALACNNPIIIQDDFEGADQFTTTETATNGASHTESLSGTGGNPGGYRHMGHSMTPSSDLYVYHSFTGGGYEPAVDGAIDHINYYEDQIEINPPFGGAQIGWGFFFEQGGTRFTKVIGNAAYGNTTWLTNQILDMTQATFPAADFSASGGPISFGYYRANTNSSAGASYPTTHGIDNFKVQICR